MSEIYVLTLVLSLAGILALLVKRFNQPLIVSYVLAGALVSIFGVVNPSHFGFLQFIPEVGLAFLLFLVGMELDVKQFKSLGIHIVITSLAQILISSVLLFLLFIRLGAPTSFLISVPLSFSSTILIVKLLLENKTLTSLHGKLAIGISLVEDLLAVILLIALSLSGHNEPINSTLIASTFIKGFTLIAITFLVGRKIYPRLLNSIAENAELLFLSGIAWCLLIVSLSVYLGFSVGIGAFLAGVVLAQSTFRVQISGKIKPLRDFFIMIFFINLGASMTITEIGSSIPIVITLVLYTILIKPTIFFFFLTFSRFRVRAAFQAALLLSSISEFTLIVVFVASSSHLLTARFASDVILATIVSFIFSSLLITHSARIYNVLRKFLKPLERSKVRNFDFVPAEKEYINHAVLIGCSSSGVIIMKNLKRIFGEELLTLDFDPEVISYLKDNGIACLYGDITDPEIQERLNLKEAKLVVSTIGELHDNLILLDYLEKVQSHAVVILTAGSSKEAINLYERGAHHVSLPFNLEGINIGHILSTYQHDFRALAADRERKLGELKRSTQ